MRRRGSDRHSYHGDHLPVNDLPKPFTSRRMATTLKYTVEALGTQRASRRGLQGKGGEKGCPWGYSEEIA